MLQEPRLPASLEWCLTSLGRDFVELRDSLKSIRESYLDWLTQRTHSLISWLESRDNLPAVLALPECACPLEILQHWKEFSVRNKVAVFAGTHSPRISEPAKVLYRKLGVNKQALRALFKDDVPPPAIAPVFTPDETVLHSKVIPSIFERIEVSRSSSRSVTPTIINVAGIRVGLLVCAEALQLVNLGEDAPDCVVILSYDKQPSRFTGVIDHLRSNKIPVVYANDGAFGGSGILSAKDARDAGWWWKAPNNGILPVGEAYLEVCIDMAARAVEVGVAAPPLPSSLGCVAPIYGDGDPLAEIEVVAQSAADDRNSVKLTGIRADLEANHPEATLANRRWAFLENLASNESLSPGWINCLGKHHLTTDIPALRSLERALLTTAANALEKFLDYSTNLIKSPEQIGQIFLLSREIRKLCKLPADTAGDTPHISTKHGGFVGRENIVPDIRSFALHKSSTIFSLFGLHAIGKSAVVRTSLEQAAARVLYVDCREGCSADYIFESLITRAGKVATGVPPRAEFDVLDLADAFKAFDVVWLEGCHNLIDHGLWRTAPLKRLLDAIVTAVNRHNCVLFLESRRNLPLEVPPGVSFVRRRLLGLNVPDSLALLEQHLRRAGVIVQDIQEDELRLLCKYVDGHPGMIMLCADAIAKSDIYKVLSELSNKRGFFLDAVVGLLNEFNLSLSAKKAIELLSRSSFGVPIGALECIGSRDEVRLIVSELQDASLVDVTALGLIKTIGLIHQTQCFTNVLEPTEIRAFHKLAATILAGFAKTTSRESALSVAIEANYHAATAGIGMVCKTGGMIDGVSAAARRKYEDDRFEDVVSMLGPLEHEGLPEDMLAILADSYAWCNQFKDSFRIAANVVAQNRDYKWLYIEACKAALRSHRIDDARDAIALAESLEPGDYAVLLQKGHVAKRDGKRDEARYYYELAADRSERDAWPHFYLVRLLLESGDAPAAVEAAERGRALLDAMPYSRGRRNTEHAILCKEIVGLVLLEEYEKAKTCLSIIEKSESTRPEVILCSAYMSAYFAKGKGDSERIQAFNKALTRLQKRDSRKAHTRAQICLFRGKIYEELGNLREAEAEYAEACSLDGYNIHMKQSYCRVLINAARFAREIGSRETMRSAASRAAEVVRSILVIQPKNEQARDMQEDLFAEFRVQ